MKTLSEYKFKNNKSIRVVYRNSKETKKAGLPDCDAFSLEFIINGKRTGFGIRPDEMVIIINLLSEGLYKGIDGYNIGILRGYNGFSKCEKKSRK